MRATLPWVFGFAVGALLLAACTEPTPTTTPTPQPTPTSIASPITTPSPTLAPNHKPTPSPTPTPKPTPTPTHAPTPTRTLAPTETPTPTPSSVFTWEFNGFTHMPVDFRAVLGATGTCTEWPLLTPFFNYYNTNHAEGPRKWYIGACPGNVAKVYLPAKGIMSVSRAGEEMREVVYNGEKVLMTLRFRSGFLLESKLSTCI